MKIPILLGCKNFERLNYLKKFLKYSYKELFTVKSAKGILVFTKKIQPEILIISADLLTELDENLKQEILKKVFILMYDEPEEKFLNEFSEFHSKIFNSIELKEQFEFYLVSSIEMAKKYIYEKKIIKNFLLSSEKKGNPSVEWLLWRDSHKTRFRAQLSKNVIENLRNTILQGMGLNTLISYIELIDLKKKEMDSEILIPKKYLENIKKDINKLLLWIHQIERVQYYLTHKYEIEKINPEIFLKILEDSLNKLENFRIIKNHKIIVKNINFKHSIYGNSSALSIVLQEILTNAFKFSPDNTDIYISIIESKRNILLIIQNEILEIKGGISGIPEKFEQKIFEPFFRLNHFYDERYFNEDLSLGIGLSLVKYYLQVFFDANIFIKQLNHNIICGILFKKYE